MLEDFKPILRILLRFIIIYVMLILLYQFYLNTQTGLDIISKWVANQVCMLQDFFGYASSMKEYPKYETSAFILNGKIPSRMVEGCNAISIFILFLAFVFAFYSGKKTFVFAFISLIVLHIMNVLRIAGLNISYMIKPEYFKSFHDYLFPAVIYGSVVLLWLIWIKFFALKNETT